MSIDRTNLGPLTTAFTYPASCNVNVMQCTYCLIAWQGQTCSDNPNNAQGVQDNVDCWPPRTENSAITTNVALLGWGVYSPGLSCPVGYNTACSATGTTIGGYKFQFPVTGKETGVGCCPSGYSCSDESGIGQTCYSVVTKGSFPGIQCSNGKNGPATQYSVPSTGTVTLTGTTTQSASGSAAAKTVTSTETDLFNFNTVTLYAPMFQLVHQESDLPSSIPSSAASGTHHTASSGAHPGNTGAAGSGGAGGAGSHPSNTGGGAAADSTGLSTSSGSGSHLSSGATAGIAIGSVAVGVAIIAAFVFMFLKQRNQQKIIAQYSQTNLAGPPPPPPMSGPDVSYYGGTPVSAKSLPMHPYPVYEAPIESQRVELA